MGGPFLVNYLWMILWKCAKRGCMKPEHEALRLFGAGIWKPWKIGYLLRSKCHWYLQTAPDIVSYIVSDIVPDVLYMTFDIECQIDLRYWVRRRYDIFQQEPKYRIFVLRYRSVL